MTVDRLLQTVQRLEPKFIEAASIASSMQPGIAARKKSNTGTYEVDVITDADTAVQEAVLTAVRGTDLSSCRLVAEEETPSVKHFDSEGSVLLSLDPIDGTYRYAEGKPVYCLILGLQTQGRPLYTFVHYPAFNWTHRFAWVSHRSFGTPPTVHLLRSGTGAITYPYGSPQQVVPNSIRTALAQRGFTFVDKEQLGSGYGAMLLMLLNRVDGFYQENPLVVDGMVGLHYAHAHRWKIYDARTTTVPEDGPFGMRYPGYYYVLRADRN